MYNAVVEPSCISDSFILYQLYVKQVLSHSACQTDFITSITPLVVSLIQDAVMPCRQFKYFVREIRYTTKDDLQC